MVSWRRKETADRTVWRVGETGCEVERWCVLRGLVRAVGVDSGEVVDRVSGVGEPGAVVVRVRVP